MFQKWNVGVSCNHTTIWNTSKNNTKVSEKTLSTLPDSRLDMKKPVQNSDRVRIDMSGGMRGLVEQQRLQILQLRGSISSSEDTTEAAGSAFLRFVIIFRKGDANLFWIETIFIFFTFSHILQLYFPYMRWRSCALLGIYFSRRASDTCRELNERCQHYGANCALPPKAENITRTFIEWRLRGPSNNGQKSNSNSNFVVKQNICKKYIYIFCIYSPMVCYVLLHSILALKSFQIITCIVYSFK